jgi:hypothetical protein
VPDNRADAVDGELERESLVGSYFLTDADRPQEGQVVAEPSPGIYLVEVYPPDDGEARAYQTLAPLDVMGAWRFFDDVEWMREARPELDAERARDRERASARGTVGIRSVEDLEPGDRVRVKYGSQAARQLTVAEVRPGPDGTTVHLVTPGGRVYPVPPDAEVEVLPS